MTYTRIFSYLAASLTGHIKIFEREKSNFISIETALPKKKNLAFGSLSEELPLWISLFSCLRDMVVLPTVSSFL